MNYPPEQAANILRIARNIMDEDTPPADKLPNMWRTVAAIHAVSLAKAVQQKIGDTVYSGPFKGMKMPACFLDGMFAPRLLGVYEHELHPIVERVIASTYHTILNIGCSYGYYAAGLALRMLQVTVHAFDIDIPAQNGCREIASLNGVSDRVHVSGEFHGEDFARFAGPETLLMMDIEGDEQTMLDPVRWPALREMDIIVELHECFKPGIIQAVMQRFSATHDLELIHNRSISFPLETIFGENVYLDHFDNMVATFEGRNGPTPWVVMRKKR